MDILFIKGEWEAKYIADDSPKEMTINGLLPGNTYMIRVKASNRGGNSPPSTSVTFKLSTDLPAIPSNPSWIVYGHAPSTRSMETSKNDNELSHHQLGLFNSVNIFINLFKAHYLFLNIICYKGLLQLCMPLVGKGE